MFVVVDRFRFRPMGQDERQRMLQRWEQDFAPLARQSPGFRGVHFVQLSDDEVLTDWHWNSAADGDAAQARFGRF
jgi:heme-degrading monooxygenase HmoA